MKTILALAVLTACAFLAGTAEAATRVGNWTTEELSDEFSDHRGWQAYSKGKPSGVLQLICYDPGDGNRWFKITFAVSQYDLGLDRQVDFRVDNRRPFTIRTEKGRNQTIGSSTYDQGLAEMVVRQVAAAKTRIIFRSGGETARISAKGSTAAANYVLTACGLDEVTP